MRLHYFTFLALFIAPFYGFSQASFPKFEWLSTFGGAHNEEGNAMEVDSNGNIYSTGYFTGIVDFDPGNLYSMQTSSGDKDVYIQKINAQGEFIWAKKIGGLLTDVGTSIAVDQSGAVYTIGYFEGSVDFDPNSGVEELHSNGGTDFFVQKLDSNGVFMWAKSFGGVNDDYALFIEIDNNGNIIINGSFKKLVDFDPGLNVANLESTYTQHISSNDTTYFNDNSDIFILKLNSEGDYIWANKTGNEMNEYACGVDSDEFGNIYTVGKYNDTLDVDPSSDTLLIASKGFSDVYLKKLSPNGDLIWVKTLDGTGNVFPTVLYLDHFNNIIISGKFSDSVDFDPGSDQHFLSSISNNNTFVLKLDSTGGFEWVNKYGRCNLSTYVKGIGGDSDGNIYQVGTYNDLNGIDASYVKKTNQNGNEIWFQSFGGSSTTFGKDIAVDKDDVIYILGGFSGTIDFDHRENLYEVTSNGMEDVYIQKFSPCTASYSIDYQSTCNSFTWIDGKTYDWTHDTGTYTTTNSDGCDSIIILNLSVDYIYPAVYQSGATLTAGQEYVNYVWLNCDDYSEVIGENSQTFTATTVGSYALEVSRGNCKDTSECLTINTVGFKSNEKEKIEIINNFDGAIIINCKDLKNVTFVIYNIQGQIISRKEQINEKLIEFTLDIDTGIYFLEIEHKGKLEVKKFYFKN